MALATDFAVLAALILFCALELLAVISAILDFSRSRRKEKARRRRAKRERARSQEQSRNEMKQ